MNRWHVRLHNVIPTVIHVICAKSAGLPPERTNDGFFMVSQLIRMLVVGVYELSEEVAIFGPVTG